jgi:hypothetical protein
VNGLGAALKRGEAGEGWLEPDLSADVTLKDIPGVRELNWFELLSAVRHHGQGDINKRRGRASHTIQSKSWYLDLVSEHNQQLKTHSRIFGSDR